ELEVPLAHAGLHVDGHEALSIKIVARPMAAVIVRRRRFDWQIDEAKLRIGADMRPDADIAIDRPGIVLPGLVARLSRSGNRIEPPDLLAGPDVERAHQALGVVVAGDCRALLHGGADDHHVADHRRRGVDADLAGLEIDLLLGATHDADLEIDDAIVAE